MGTTDMNEEEDIFEFPKVEDKTVNIIKVIGVGGGGGNAVQNMFREGVYNVSFAVCNTDSQALKANEVPMKVQLGPGLGAGGDPEKGRAFALEELEQVNRLFDDHTQMVFITAGMGGGTGTGAGPVIAKAARDRGILTIGVVTLPFAFEQSRKINKAMEGVAAMRKSVDALLVINNERLRDMEELSMENSFKKADEVLTTATRSIAEIITRQGIINRDFCDVKAVTENGGSAIISEGRGSGDHRVEKAMMNALKSPLLNSMDITKSKRLLYVIYQSDAAPLMTSELGYITDFMNELENEVDVNWGLYRDESLGEEVKVSIIATGFDDEDDEEMELNGQEQLHASQIAALRDKYYGPKDAVVIKLGGPEPDEDGAVPERSTNVFMEESGREGTEEDDPEDDGESLERETDPAPSPKSKVWGGWMNKLENFLKED